MSFQHEDSSDNDSDYYERDPGRDVIEKNIRNRLQRIADHTKDELNKVLKRVDTTLNNYEYSVQSSLIQHGMSMNDMSNVEHVADIKELENLLNDSLAKQRYKQRLMVFIVGQTEQASEKSKLLQQIEQFFNEQKQSFSGSEFNTLNDTNQPPDEVDLSLKSFDVKDCYVHVKTLGTRLTELNEDIIHYLIQNAGSKQQAKGRKKLAQAAKETREQLANLQSSLEMANNEMIDRDHKIESLEKEIEKSQTKTKTLEYKLHHYETEIQSYKTTINELEDNLEQYKNQINDLTKTLQQPATEETSDTKITSGTQTEETNQIDVEEVQLITIPNGITKTPPIEKLDKEIQTSFLSDENSEQIPSENIDDLNSTNEIDSNNITIESLQNHAVVRIRELLRELEIKESIENETVQNLQQQFNNYKELCEKEQNDLSEKAEHAYQLQIKAQRTAEEAISHLQAYMAVQESNEKPQLFDQETQTDELDTSLSTTPSPEYTNPISEPSNRHLSSQSKTTTDGFESIENFRHESLKDKYITLIDEKKQELNQLKQQADIILSRPTSIRNRISLQSLENSAVLIKQQPSFSFFDSGEEMKENQPDVEPRIQQDQGQQTSPSSSRRSSTEKEIILTQSNPFKLPFFHLYETIYKFHQSIIHLLEQNKLVPLANCLHMIKQLSSNDNLLTNDFVENAEGVLKEITKVLQTSMSALQSTINEFQLKETEMIKESEPLLESSVIDTQQSLILEQKESMLVDLTNKYEHLSKIFNQSSTKYEGESSENQRLVHEQQKLIQSLQQDLTRLQKRLVKLETQGIVEPSIMFTRLDAERNDQTLQHAVHKGKVSANTYNELNEAMTDYIELPSQQLSNLVKRYIQFRRATALEDRIQSEVLDNDTKSVLEKMESLHERRSDQMGKRMIIIRQQRTDLAKQLTEKFDELEDQSSIFLIRPIYSYQGRAAAQSYMQEGNRRREAFLKENEAKKKHNPSRQSVKTRSAVNQQMTSSISSLNNSDDEERLFRIEKSVPSATRRQNSSKKTLIQFTDLTRLEEIGIQRILMPTSHATTPLLSAFTNNTVDPAVPSLNLRSYVALSRPGVGSFRKEKPNEISSPISQERLSVRSAKSQTTAPHTPYNSSVGGIRRVGPSLPPIKRSLTSSVTPVISERQHGSFIPSMNTNEIATAD